MSEFKISYLFLFLLFFFIISCSSDSPLDPKEEDIPLGNFSLIAPENESAVVYDQPMLSWEETDNDFIYEIRLSKSNPPSKIIARGLERPEYTPDIDLEPGSTYYWQIIATSESGEKTKSIEIHSFTYRLGSGVIANVNMGMLLRQEHSLVVFKDKLWMFGGRQHRFGMKDVWYSEDGINWELAIEEVEFPARVQHTAFVYDDKMWLIGGEIVGGFFKDIWYTEDGSHWVEAADDTPLGRRNGHSSVVFDNKMWVIGGSEISDDFNETYIRNDAWYSTDGTHWTQATNDADFKPRTGHKSVVFDDKMWVIGGYGHNDVWYSENGIDWTMATENAGFGNLIYFECVVFDNKIWIIGGFVIDESVNGTVGTVSQEIWYSNDGINWQQTDLFFGRSGHANAVFKNKIWGVGGGGATTNNNDSWYLNVP